MIFPVKEEYLNELKSRDSRLACVIDAVGMIEREGFEDEFEALIHAIVSQQISNAALQTVWTKFKEKLEVFSPQTCHTLSIEDYRSCGISERKAKWIKAVSEQIVQGEINLKQLKTGSDEEIINSLIQIKGIGKWSSQMLCIFAYYRLDIMSLDDLGIQKGICRLYELDEFSKAFGQELIQRFSPYNTIASFYLWTIGNLSDWDKQKKEFMV